MAYFYTYMDPDQLAKPAKADDDDGVADLWVKGKENIDMIDVIQSTKI